MKPTLAILAVLLVTVMANAAFTKSDYVKYYANESLTDDLFNAYSVYLVCNPTGVAVSIPATTSVISKDNTSSKGNALFNTSFITEGKSAGLQDDGIAIWTVRNVTRYETGFNETFWKNVTDGNGTHPVYNVTPYNFTRVVTTAGYEDFDPYGFKAEANTCYKIKVYGHKTITLGSNNVDNVLSFAGYSFPEYAWWNSSFLYKNSVIINSTVGTTLTNFTGYFKVDTQTLISQGKMNNSCKDLRVVNTSEDVMLSYEIENNTCNTTNTIVWFKYPSLNPGNTTIYVYFGSNTTADSQNPTDLWLDYVLVMHFGETAGAFKDSSNATGVSLIGERLGTLSDIGVYGNGLNLNSGNVSIATNALYRVTTAFTIVSWVRRTGNNVFTLDQLLSTSLIAYSLHTTGNTNTLFYGGAMGSLAAIATTANVYAFTAGVQRLAGSTAWKDAGPVVGTLLTTGVYTVSAPLCIGGSSGVTTPYNCAPQNNGSVDEVRLSNQSFSNNTILAIYGQQYWYNTTIDNAPATGDTTPPQWTQPAANQTTNGTLTKFSAYWTDNIFLMNYTFSLDNGNGTFYNFSDNISMNGASNWSNATWIINATPNSAIRWIIYAWDNSSNINNTGIQSFSTKSVNPPLWSLNSSNTTLAGEHVNLSVKWNDDFALGNYTLQLDNGNGTFYNQTTIPFTGTLNWSNTDWTLNSTVGSAIRWRYYSNDSFGNFNVTSIFTLTTTTNADTTPPQWTQNQSNNTVVGRMTLFSVYWTDNSALNNYTFSFDNGSGTFVNDSVASMIGTANWSNVSKVINQTIGSVIRWRVYAWDVTGNFNVTAINQFTTTQSYLVCTGAQICFYFYDYFFQENQGNTTNGKGNIYYRRYAEGTDWFLATWGGEAQWQCGTECVMQRLPGLPEKENNRTLWLDGDSTNFGAITWTSLGKGTVYLSWDALGSIDTMKVVKTNNVSSTPTSTIYSASGNTSFVNLSISVNYGDTIAVLSDSVQPRFIYNLSLTGSIALSSVNINGFDENSPSTPKLFNLTIANATNSTSYQVDYTWFNKSLDDIPSGIITLTARNASCQTGNVIDRSMVKNTSTDDLSNLTFYFLCDGYTSAYQSIVVIDLLGNSISGATVTINRTISGIPRTIVSTTTDGAGQVVQYLTTAVQYTATVSKPGYTSTTTTFYASNNILQITLNAPVAYPIYDFISSHISFSYVPLVFLNYPVFSFNLTVGTSDNISYYGFNLSMGNGTQLAYFNYTNSTGGFITSGHIDRTNWTYGNITAVVFIGKNGYNEYNFTVYYSFANQSDSNSSVTGIANNLQLVGFPATLKVVIAAFASLMFAAGGFLAFGGAGAGLAFVASFGFFSLGLNFVDPVFFYLLSILVIAIYSINKGL